MKKFFDLTAISTFFGINLKDIIKGVIVAVWVALLGNIRAIINTGSLPTVAEWKTIGMACLWAWLSYLVKNLLTDSNGKFLTVVPK